MQETCSCGAHIATLQYRRVIQWRAEHRHEVDEYSPEGAESKIELSYPQVTPEPEPEDRRAGFRRR